MSPLPLTALAIFAAVLVVAWLTLRREQDASLTWPEAAGTVLSVEARPAVGRGSGRREQDPVWQPWLRYEYEVEGQRYTGERMGLDPAAARLSRSEVDDVLRPYRPGTAVRVRYHPQRPQRAVLIPGRG